MHTAINIMKITQTCSVRIIKTLSITRQACKRQELIHFLCTPNIFPGKTALSKELVIGSAFLAKNSTELLVCHCIKGYGLVGKCSIE